MKRQNLDPLAIDAWLQQHPGWSREGVELTRAYAFPDYPATIAFVTRVGFAAEKHDHHPFLGVGWCKVKVAWSTHDTGGVTELDLKLAELTDALAR